MSWTMLREVVTSVDKDKTSVARRMSNGTGEACEKRRQIGLEPLTTHVGQMHSIAHTNITSAHRQRMLADHGQLLARCVRVADRSCGQVTGSWLAGCVTVAGILCGQLHGQL